MLFSALILIAVNRKHDCLKQGINLSHGDQTTKMCDVPRLGLKEEQQVAVFLCLFIVGKESLL